MLSVNSYVNQPCTYIFFSFFIFRLLYHCNVWNTLKIENLKKKRKRIASTAIYPQLPSASRSRRHICCFLFFVVHNAEYCRRLVFSVL